MYFYYTTANHFLKKYVKNLCKIKAFDYRVTLVLKRNFNYMYFVLKWYAGNLHVCNIQDTFLKCFYVSYH